MEGDKQMKICEIIKELRESTKFNFEKRAVIYRKYRDILKKEIDLNPSNVKAVSLMAMIFCELREKTEKSIEILEKCYDENKSEFSDEEISLLSTNLAYFLLEEFGPSSEERAIKLLLGAINRNSNYSNTYYAYGKICFMKKDFKNAARMFEKAFELFTKKSYKYCQAISLLKNSNQQAGISKLKSIYIYPFEDEEIDAKVALTLGRELAISGNIYKAKEIASNLLRTDYINFDIETDEMADFMYILKDYKTCVQLYDRCGFLEDASWLNKYFYALKQEGKVSLAENKLEEIINKIEAGIEEEKMNPTDWKNDEDYHSYIISEIKRLKDIKEGYNKIFVHSIDILPDAYYDIIYECYYINCPRHYSE